VYQPLIWRNAFARSICRGLFDPIKPAPGAGWSITNAVGITNIPDMQAAFIEHFQKCYDHGIWCIETREPQAITKQLPPGS
jgi:hypothetical protein